MFYRVTAPWNTDELWPLYGRSWIYVVPPSHKFLFFFYRFMLGFLKKQQHFVLLIFLVIIMMGVLFVFCMAKGTSYTKLLKIIWNILFYRRIFKLEASFRLSHRRNDKKKPQNIVAKYYLKHSFPQGYVVGQGLFFWVLSSVDTNVSSSMTGKKRLVRHAHFLPASPCHFFYSPRFIARVVRLYSREKTLQRNTSIWRDAPLWLHLCCFDETTSDRQDNTLRHTHTHRKTHSHHAHVCVTITQPIPRSNQNVCNWPNITARNFE